MPAVSPVQPAERYALRLRIRSTFLIDDRFQSYTVSPDGTRVLMIQRDPDSVPRRLNVILNLR